MITRSPAKGQRPPVWCWALFLLCCGSLATPALVSVILGIVGLILAGNAKKAGFVGGMQTAGFVLSLIGLIGGAIFFVACVACAGAIGAVGGSDALRDLFNQ